MRDGQGHRVLGASAGIDEGDVAPAGHRAKHPAPRHDDRLPGHEDLDVAPKLGPELGRRRHGIVLVGFAHKGFGHGRIHGERGRLPDHDGIAFLSEVAPVAVPKLATLGVGAADAQEERVRHRGQRGDEGVDCKRRMGPARIRAIWWNRCWPG
jgi:hypothetical protein